MVPAPVRGGPDRAPGSSSSREGGRPHSVPQAGGRPSRTGQQQGGRPHPTPGGHAVPQGGKRLSVPCPGPRGVCLSQTGLTPALPAESEGGRVGPQALCGLVRASYPAIHPSIPPSQPRAGGLHSTCPYFGPQELTVPRPLGPFTLPWDSGTPLVGSCPGPMAVWAQSRWEKWPTLGLPVPALFQVQTPVPRMHDRLSFHTKS